MARNKLENLILFSLSKSPKSFSDLQKELKQHHKKIGKRTLRVIVDHLEFNKVIYQLKPGVYQLPVANNKTDNNRTEKKRGSDKSHKHYKSRLGTRHAKKTQWHSDFDYILDKYKYVKDFPALIRMELDRLKGPTPGDGSFEKRQDFRADLVITIDGEDAKDLDDAVSLVKTTQGYDLSVHIADVSYYVRENSKIDKTALKRANSVYLVDKVIPMLPEKLSNDLCSLNPHTDKYTLSIVVSISGDGEIQRYKIYQGIINTHARMNYHEVHQLLHPQDTRHPETYHRSNYDPALLSMLAEMETLSGVLNRKRTANGSINFDLTDTKILCDKHSFPVDIKVERRLSSHGIIEEFMLTANRCIAQFLSEKGPSVYRIHDEPDEEKVGTLIKFINKMGFRLTEKDFTDPKQFNDVIEKASQSPYSKIVSTLMLRSMKQACYDTDNRGHFGLAFKYYTHFTSPIRRYPDLVIHRLVRNAIGLEPLSKDVLRLPYLDKVCSKASKLERVAEEAEREIVKRKAAQFMSNKVGEIYEGVISGTTGAGLFIEISDYGIEGFVPVRILEGYYVYDADNLQFYPQNKKGKTYQMGDKVKVRIDHVNLDRMFIDMSFVD